MTPKQRFIAAMNFIKPDDMVAMMEIEFHIYEEYVGKKLIIGYEFSKLSSKEKEKALYYNADVMIETAQKAGHDAIRNIPGYWEIAPGEPGFMWLPDYETQLEQLKALKNAAGNNYFLIGNGGGEHWISKKREMLSMCKGLSEYERRISGNAGITIVVLR